ncbi:DUF2079 domain-containing protein [Mangrovihabitans endophyticus]|uniref:Glycosyl transferase n=1 Tax=Mangrovihabitans endophyticus TaxID=1751298 RepID=A0A8J3BZB5_9ACTN|nr:DUF2079 domain-containing protein [Mangrovihabitans endophyticus]GGK87863.1 glycosyl transferase [Mangrovihabitans endophyticus]
MSVATPTASADPPATPEGAPSRLAQWRWHLSVTALALALAVWITWPLWTDPYRQALTQNAGDQAFFEWLLGYGVHLLRAGGDPFFSQLLNAPLGVNLAANTSITVYIILFAPISWLLGPQISFVLILTLNLAAAAVVWYAFLLRHVTPVPAAAAVGGLFAGFAPGFVSHANGHLNWSAGWVAPAVLWWVLRLREPGRWLRNGAVLGLLLAIGFSIAAEGLFFTALASAVFLITWACARVHADEVRAAAAPLLKGLAVAAVVAGLLLAYPLYMHFAGPQSFSGTGFNQRRFVEDVVSTFAWSSGSLAGHAHLGSSFLAPNDTEQTSFFGLPLVVLVVVALGRLWRAAKPGRRATLRALMVVGAVFTVLSWGPRLQFLEIETPIPLPYAALAHLPLFDSALPARFALVVAGVIAVVLALAAERALTRTRRSSTWAVAFVVALVPLLPMPLQTMRRAPEPEFIASGDWQRYVPDGGVLSALPFAINTSPDAQRWQAYTLARGGPQFRIPDGYFLGPGGQNGTGQIGAPWRHTDWLFFRAARYGFVTRIDDYDRAQARADFAYWDVRAVFLPAEITGPDGMLFRSATEIAATDLLGPPEHVDDVLLWRIRPGVDPVTDGF